MKISTLAVYLLLTIWPSIVNAQAGKQINARVLPPNQTFTSMLKGGEKHTYEIRLKAGQYLHVEVNQQGIDVELTLSDANGEGITKRDTPNEADGPESLSFIVTTGGLYRLNVQALEKDAPVGRYEIRREAPRTPTIQDKKRVEAETVFQEGLRLQGPKAEKSTSTVCEKFEAAAALWKELADKYAEALVQTSAGYCRSQLEEQNLTETPADSDEARRAVAAYERALTLYRELSLRRNIADSLLALCDLNANLAKPELALAQCREAGSIYSELKDAARVEQLRSVLATVAREYYDLGEKLSASNTEGRLRQALRIFEVVVEMFRLLEDEENEANSLLSLGQLHSNLGEKLKALDNYNQALPLYERVGNKTGEAISLNNIGRIYSDVGQDRTALDYFGRALARTAEFKTDDDDDKSLKGTILNNTGLAYSNLSERKKAFDHYNQALLQHRSGKDKRGEASTLDNLGLEYDASGEKQTALDHYGQAKIIWVEINDAVGKARNLSNTGFVYQTLGERHIALDYYNAALPLLRTAGDERSVATVLNNIGAVYDSLGETQKAFDYYNQALPLRRSVGDKSGEATTLNNISLVLRASGEKEKALTHAKEALTIRQEIGDKSGEANTLNNIGGIHDWFGDRQQAHDYYNQALVIWKAISDTSGEATTLGNLMGLWYSRGNLRLATLYGKQAVNALQKLREQAQRLSDKDIQKTFLKSVEDNYRDLAKLLVEQKRLAEALQVLNSLKDQQYFDFDPRTLKKPVRLSMTEREKELSSGFDKTTAEIARVGTQLLDLNIAVGFRTPRPEDDAKFNQLKFDLSLATEHFLSVTKQAETDLSGQLDPIKDKPPDITDIQELQKALRDLSKQTPHRVAALYTSAGKASLLTLIVTHGSVTPVITAIKSQELNDTARRFLVQLSQFDRRQNTPKFTQAEVQKTAKELHDTVFAPVAAKLKTLGEKPDVLMWFLDGPLRSVPVAALYDGRHYLAENYRNVVFTRADAEQMISPVSRSWRGSGFYNSKEYNLAVLGEMETFEALRNAKAEMEDIFGTQAGLGILSGDFIGNQDFDKASFFKNLGLHRPLVHIASHFRLVPGDASASFLLLGTGDKLTLTEIKEKPDDLFAGVELLTLSACETGAGKERKSDGREIDSFAELAQRKKAHAILASLWNVDDGSTGQLMKQFYQMHQLKKLTKAEALQKAQLDLLKDSRYAHPFFWAPFILVGNWR